MLEDVRARFDDVLHLWGQMQTSHLDEAGDDAERFQTAFYRFTDDLADWVRTLDVAPPDLETARANPCFADFFERMPHPLHIPFEMELESILEGAERHVDSTQQS